MTETKRNCLSCDHITTEGGCYRCDAGIGLISLENLMDASECSNYEPMFIQAISGECGNCEFWTAWKGRKEYGYCEADPYRDIHEFDDWCIGHYPKRKRKK